jgi:nicotinamide-nucleotide amidase
MMTARYEALATALGDALRRRGEWLGAAESCTGGLIAAACTSVAGSSEWFERGFVTYSNAAKTSVLGVPAGLIDAHGAVSEPVVEAMARGVLARAPVQWTVAVTGIAGPGGGVPGKPVGTVWLCWGDAARLDVRRLQLGGDRAAIRERTVEAALRALLERLS